MQTVSQDYQNNIKTIEINIEVRSELNLIFHYLRSINNCVLTPMCCLSTSLLPWNSRNNIREGGASEHFHQFYAPQISLPQNNLLTPQLTYSEQGLLLACPAGGKNKSAHALALIKKCPTLKLDRLSMLTGACKSNLLRYPGIAIHYGRCAPLTEQEQAMLLACPADGKRKITHALELIEKYPKLALDRLVTLTGTYPYYLLGDPGIAAHYGRRAPLSQEEQAILIACPADGKRKIAHALEILDKYPTLTLARLVALTGARKTNLLHVSAIAAHYGRKKTLSGNGCGNEMETARDVTGDNTRPKRPSRKRPLSAGEHSENAVPEQVIKKEEDIVTW